MAAPDPVSAPASSAARTRASESIADKLTRPMRAAVSPYGVLIDPPVVSSLVALVVLPAIILYQTDVIPPRALPIVYALAAAPIAVALVVNLLLLGVRGQVVDWLASLPFAVENLNALLNGMGQNLIVRFADAPPERDTINAIVEAVHEDSFALEYAEDEPEVQVRIGVQDSKLNPAAASHRRYRRVRELVDRALVPLHEEHRIVSVQIC